MSFEDDFGDEIEYERLEESYRIRYERESSATSLVLVRAIAAIEGVDPITLEPLCETVDVDALDATIRSMDADFELTFSYHGYRTTIRGEGSIELWAIDPDGASPT